jgi:hypothetical protein
VSLIILASNNVALLISSYISGANKLAVGRLGGGGVCNQAGHAQIDDFLHGFCNERTRDDSFAIYFRLCEKSQDKTKTDCETENSESDAQQCY